MEPSLVWGLTWLFYKNNLGDDLTLITNGSFILSSSLDDLSAYDVMVKTQATALDQFCLVILELTKYLVQMLLMFE